MAASSSDGVEHLARRTNKRLACDILLIAGLFADEHDRRILRPFAKNGLGRLAPKWATAAAFAQLCATAGIDRASAPSSPLSRLAKRRPVFRLHLGMMGAGVVGIFSIISLAAARRQPSDEE